MASRLEIVLAAIDAANAADPRSENGPDGPEPANLLYGKRMSAELEHLFPDATEHLQIAARGQHIERWMLPRADYPDGLAGYLVWRKDQADRHADRVAELMGGAGYTAEDMARVGMLLRKERMKRDRDVQRLEDVVCFVFLRWYFSSFAEGRAQDQLDRIINKTARKMSPVSRARALSEFYIPAPFDTAFAAR